MPWTDALRRLPLTISIFFISLVLAVATGSLWNTLQDRDLRDTVAYGLPAFEAGRWWTLVTGIPFASRPWQYLFLFVGVAVLGGFAEWRLGTRRAAIVMLGGQLIGVLGAALFLRVASGHIWGWATALADDFGAGPGAAMLGAAAVASATVPPPWRFRLRLLILGYPLVSVLYVGDLADLENLIAVLVGLVVGPIMLGGRPRLSAPNFTRREFRAGAAGFLGLSAVGAIVDWLAPVSGPLARSQSNAVQAEALSDSQSVPWVFLIQVVVFLVLARGVYRGRRIAWRWAVGLTSVFLVLLLLTAVSLAINGEPGWPSVVYQLLLNVGGLWILVAGRRAFRNPSPRRARRTGSESLLARSDTKDQSEARELLRTAGTVNRLAWMTTWPENRWYHQPGEQGYVAYRVHAGVAVGLCDPVAATAQERSALFAGFADRAHRDGLVPCIFTVTAEAAQNAVGQGWTSVQVAEEAVIELKTLAFTGKKWQDIRTALNQAKKQEITYRTGSLAQLPRGLQTQVRAISDGWVGDKGLPEMGFTLGGVDEALDPDVRVGLAVDADGTVHGVTSWLPIHDPGGELVGWTLDVMRRLPDGFRYAMEFLIASACLAFQQEGYRWVSLSGAPLARSETIPGTAMPAPVQSQATAPAAQVSELKEQAAVPIRQSGAHVAEPAYDHLDTDLLDSFLQRLAQTLEPYYGFQSLHSFKTKFQPRFEPLYLIFPDEAVLPRIGIALTRAYLPDAGVRDLVSAARGG